MKSITNLLEVIEQLKTEADAHSLTTEQIDALNEICEKLEGIQKRDIVKDAAEISLTIPTTVKLIVEWFVT